MMDGDRGYTFLCVNENSKTPNPTNMFGLIMATAPRLDWGFGNPNKTATLIATIMLAVWVLPKLASFASQRMNELFFWLTLTLSVTLGVPLILTESRGGIVAFLAGLMVLALHAPRPY